MSDISFLRLLFFSFVDRLPCSPGVTLAFVAASTETLEETEMDENAGEEIEVETEQEEPQECTEVACVFSC